MGRLPSAIADRQRLLKIADLTNARVGLENHGGGLSTRDSLAFLLDHARARDAVHASVDEERLSRDVKRAGMAFVASRSKAGDRATYLRRPDLGRSLAEDSRRALDGLGSGFDIAVVLADGLSARALEKHAGIVVAGLLDRFAGSGRTVGPAVYVRNGRVAVGDEIGQALKARLVIVLIGERPGLSSPDSLGAYVTLNPAVGTPDSRRNCISNIHDRGLAPGEAPAAIAGLVDAIWRHNVSGVALPKGDAGTATLTLQTARKRPGGG